MQALAKVRLSDKHVEVLEAGKHVIVPAPWEEFEEFLAETDYRAEYHNGQIIIIGLETIIHELLVIRLGYLLTGYYLGKPFYAVGSNAGIRKDGKKGHYNGDVLVVKGNPVFQGKSRSIITNPYLIIEILSESTFNYDLGAKRRKYEQMETVQELVFVDPFDREVIVCRRTEQANVWTETVYTVAEQLMYQSGGKSLAFRRRLQFNIFAYQLLSVCNTIEKRVTRRMIASTISCGLPNIVRK